VPISKAVLSFWQTQGLSECGPDNLLSGPFLYTIQKIRSIEGV